MTSLQFEGPAGAPVVVLSNALGTSAALWDGQLPAEDEATTPADARALAAGIRGAVLEIVPAAAHLPNVEQPEAVNRVLARFLRNPAP